MSDLTSRIHIEELGFRLSEMQARYQSACETIAQQDAELTAERERIAELEADQLKSREAILREYAADKLHADWGCDPDDDMTAALAVELVKRDERIAELESELNEAKTTWQHNSLEADHA